MHPLEQELRTLEAEAQRAGPGEAARVYDRAGDLCLGAGSRDRALDYYGRAIDAALVARRYNAAAGLCRKLLRVAPGTVRTRCTLAWLALGRGNVGETTREIDAYTDAAARAGRTAFASAHLRMMAQITPVPALRRHIADRLERLGLSDFAAPLREGLTADDGVPVLTAADHEQLWNNVVRCALMGPADLHD